MYCKKESCKEYSKQFDIMPLTSLYNYKISKYVFKNITAFVRNEEIYGFKSSWEFSRTLWKYSGYF